MFSFSSLGAFCWPLALLARKDKSSQITDVIVTFAGFGV